MRAHAGRQGIGRHAGDDQGDEDAPLPARQNIIYSQAEGGDKLSTLDLGLRPDDQPSGQPLPVLVIQGNTGPLPVMPVDLSGNLDDDRR